MAKILGGIIVVVIIIVALFVWQGKKADAPVSDSSQTVPEDTVSSDTAATEDKGMVASIKDAMGLGKTMQCTYSMTKGTTTVQSEVRVEGEKFKSKTLVNGMEMYGLFDGENQYSWTNASKVGTKLSKACLEKMQLNAQEMRANTPDGGPASNDNDLRAGFDMAKNVACEAASTIDMTLPADVTFTDQCALMEQSMKMIEQMKGTMPEGMTPPSMPNPAY